MATVALDCLGLRCPQPILKIAAKSAELKAGDILEVIGGLSDIREGCPSVV